MFSVFRYKKDVLLESFKCTMQAFKGRTSVTLYSNAIGIFKMVVNLKYTEYIMQWEWKFKKINCLLSSSSYYGGQKFED